MENEVTEKKLEKYFKISEEALELAKKNIAKKELAEDFLDMIERYLKDAKYFQEKGNWVTAFAALNYAHGWLDAGARAKIFNVKDSRLFTVDEK